MRINVRFFAIVREKAGTGQAVLELDDDAAVVDALAAIAAKFPGAKDHLKNVAYAVNREYVFGDIVLKDGDELAIIPPVSGG